LSPAGGGGASGPHYDVTITRTAYGIPHIRAADYGSLGYGYGYAFAQDNLCTFMQNVVTLRGQRAFYFGATGSYSIPAVPVTADNVDSDFFWRFMADDAAVQRFENQTTAPVRELTTGYRDGINRYIAELKAGDHPGANAACAGAPWLQALTSADLYRRYIQLAILASSEAFIPQIATAQPPSVVSADAAQSGPPSGDPRTWKPCSPAVPARSPSSTARAIWAATCTAWALAPPATGPPSCSAIHTFRGPAPSGCTPPSSPCPAR
jgi:Protein related to penicillin acylase